MVLLSWHLSVVFYEYKSSQLIIKSDRYDLSYHCNFSMVFKATITIEWNGWGKPSMIDGFLMVFGSPTIVFDGFRWLSTNAIGQTMRCDGPSFQSFPKYWKAVLLTLWGAQISQSKNDLITTKFEEKKIQSQTLRNKCDQPFYVLPLGQMVYILGFISSIFSHSWFLLRTEL